jgi:hypothetical protein
LPAFPRAPIIEWNYENEGPASDKHPPHLAQDGQRMKHVLQTVIRDNHIHAFIIDVPNVIVQRDWHLRSVVLLPDDFLANRVDFNATLHPGWQCTEDRPVSTTEIQHALGLTAVGLEIPTLIDTAKLNLLAEPALEVLGPLVPQIVI